MKIFEHFRKRRAIKAFVKLLPSLLKGRFGKHKRYTQAQIKKTIIQEKLNYDYIDYALAMYISRNEFELLKTNKDLSCDYDEIRQEIAENYFDGNVCFTILDALEYTETHSEFFEESECSVDADSFENSEGDSF